MVTEGAEALKRQWWDRWRRKDFSWNGLAGKRLYGWFVDEQGVFTRADNEATRPATLQDVWRSEEEHAELDPLGRLWTVVHVPLTWADGSPAKSAWSLDKLRSVNRAITEAAGRFPDEPQARVAAPGRSRTNASVSPTTARGLPFDGAVLTSTPSALAKMKRIRGDWIATEQLQLQHVDEIHLRNGLFDDGLEIGNVEDGADIRILDGIVCGDFGMAAVMAERIRIGRLAVVGRLTVDGVHATDRINLPECRVDGPVIFQRVVGDLRLAQGHFGRGVKLNEMRGNLELRDAKIEGDLTCASVFVGACKAEGLDTGGRADLTGLQVGKKADFSGSIWRRSMSMWSADLTNADFSTAEFQGGARFDQATFKGSVTFAAAAFKDQSTFRGSVWQGTAEEHSGAFRGTRFDGFVDFRTTGFEAFGAFSGAQFKNDIRLPSDLSNDQHRVQYVIRAAKTDEAKQDLENGFRALKQAAETVRSRNLEQDWFRYELLSRRAQTSTHAIERAFSAAYGVFSNYGASFVRPLAWAGLIWVLGIATYVGLGVMAKDSAFLDWELRWEAAPHPGLLAAVELSSRSMVSLFSVWSLRPLSNPTGAQAAEAALLHLTPWLGTTVRMLSTLQSLLSGVLLFLFALAARRRFQIS